MSISMAKTVVQTGSSSTVEAVTKNSSTRAVTVDTSAPVVDYDVVLRSAGGETHHLITLSALLLPQRLVSIAPGAEDTASIPVTFTKDIKPGSYTLYATRTFTLDGHDFLLKSNSIKVKIIN